jgi:hypothetical protein
MVVTISKWRQTAKPLEKEPKKNRRQDIVAPQQPRPQRCLGTAAAPHKKEPSEEGDELR